MNIRRARSATSVFLLVCAPLGAAADDGAQSWRLHAAQAAAAMGVELPGMAAAVVAFSTPPASSGLEVESEQVNFEYAEMVDRMEKLSRTVIGRNKKKKTINTGVTPADRVDRGEIKYIVLHASGGAGACDGSVTHLLGHNTAAHFMVCRDGRVTRMVKIADIANHVKNKSIENDSVGIETESGYLKAPTFRGGDWNPAAYWRLYASMAWVIRAVAKETKVPRDRAHIITHEESDRGMLKAHVDPGPFFDTGTYPEFDARFPAQAVTPREFLMRLVQDDTPPQIWMVSAVTTDDSVQIKDAASLGLSHIRIWKLDAAGKADVKTYEWSAPAAGMPPETLIVPMPRESGFYRVVARDLVGNTSAALVKVADPAAAIASATKFSLLSESVAAAAALEPTTAE